MFKMTDYYTRKYLLIKYKQFWAKEKISFFYEKNLNLFLFFLGLNANNNVFYFVLKVSNIDYTIV